MKPYNTPNIIPANTVMNTTLTSQAMPIYSQIGFAIQVVFTGTPTGSFKLQASNDSYQTAGYAYANPPVNWSDISNSSQAVTAAGNVFWNFQWSFWNYVRVVYTDTSGATSTAIITVSTFNTKS